MSKRNRFWLHFLYVIFILVFLFFGANYGLELKVAEKLSKSYRFFYTLFPILFGIVLALPNLFIEYRSIGKWTIDWVAFLAIGVPTLLISLFCVMILYTPLNKIEFFTSLSNPLVYVMFYDNLMTVLSGTIFGYVFITSFKRLTNEPN